MADDYLRVALRARLRMSRPGHDISLHHSQPTTHCQHVSVNTGTTCAELLNDSPSHPLKCPSGGEMNRGHNRLRDWLGCFVTDMLGVPVLPETLVPAWNYIKDGQEVQARLDLSFPWNGFRTYVDVAYATAATDSADRRAARAAEAGLAAQEKVGKKMQTYPPEKNPGAQLVPFVIEALGRPSDEVRAFLQALAPTNPAERAVVLSSAWQQISLITQTRLAELYLSAERTRLPR